MWLPNALMRALGERDGWACSYCGAPLVHLPEHVVADRITDFLTGVPEIAYRLIVPGMKFPSTDHVVPVASGGDNSIENRVLACVECNSRKGTKAVEEFLLQFIGEVREQMVA